MEFKVRPRPLSLGKAPNSSDTRLKIECSTYNSVLELLHERSIIDDFVICHTGGNIGNGNGDVTVSLQHTGINVLDKPGHVVTNFFLRLHRRDVHFFEHESETRQTVLSLPALSTHIFFCHMMLSYS